MPDPTVSVAAIQSHTVALQSAIGRHAANASRCKVWTGGIVAGMLLLSAGRAQMAALPWAAGVIVLLALADAGQAALAGVFTDAYNRFMAKVPLNGGNAMKPECFLLPEPVLGWRQAGLVLRALGSFSVWPFHGALLALLNAFFILGPQPQPQSDPRAGVGMSGFPVSSGSVRTFTPGPGSASFPGGTHPAQPGGFTQPGTMSPSSSAPRSNGLPPSATPPLKFPSTKVSVPIPPGSSSFRPNRTPAPAPGNDPTFTPGIPIPVNKPTPPPPGARPPAATPPPAVPQ